ADGLGEILLHHIILADPGRLLVLGTRILPLLGHDPAQAAPGISELAIQGRKVPVLTSYAPERLLGNARQRAGLWRTWLDWTVEGSALKDCYLLWPQRPPRWRQLPRQHSRLTTI